ncbi:MAG: hypothetical protein HW416_3591 [Chloroflexi bacterium]|nr:hypothetical protein [Chloroflexota bacterium]
MRERPKFIAPVATRSRLVLEMAYEMVGDWGFKHKQARITLREQGDQNPWALAIDGSDTPAAIDEVARGDAQIAIINPSDPLQVALRGKGRWKEPVPVRILTVIPSLDQIIFAVHPRTGIKTLADIRDKKYPLKVSMRRQPGHSTYFIVGEALKALGFSLDDIMSWGGAMHYHRFPPDVEAVVRGDADAIFDEAVDEWIDHATDAGLHIISLDEGHLQQLEALGLRRHVVTKAQYPALPADVPTLDFSGWPVFTRADVPDDFIRAACIALEACKDRIPWQGVGPLPLERMCIGTVDAPLTAPLHPAAEKFWREQGYIQ